MARTDITQHFADEELNHTLYTSPDWDTKYLEMPGAESRKYMTLRTERLRGGDATVTFAEDSDLDWLDPLDEGKQYDIDDRKVNLAPAGDLPATDVPRFALHRHTDSGYECMYDHWEHTLYDQDHAQDTLTYLRDISTNQTEFDNTVASLQNAYNRWDDIGIIHHGCNGNGRSTALSSIGIMVDDEAYLLAKTGSRNGTHSEFGMARFEFTQEFDWGTSPVECEPITLPKDALPDSKANRKSELYFLYEHILKPYSDTQDEALAKIDGLRERYRPDASLEDVTVREVVTR